MVYVEQVKTLATANVTREDIEFRQMEDVRMSELLVCPPFFGLG
jgi:hypothetical protein